MMRGRSLELYFVDGKPDGMLTAEVFNWTGHVLKIPRTRIADGLKRNEAANTGVYILLGNTEDGLSVYIGEAETLDVRIRQHAQQKDWWDDAVLITTAGDALHKAHVKYLEARLIEIARRVGRATLDNGNAATRSSLNEAAAANMESFLETLLMVLPAIRIDAFDERTRRVAEKETGIAKDEPVFKFTVARHGVSATAVLRDGDFVVRAGSKVRSSWVGDPKHALLAQRVYKELTASGVISTIEQETTLTEDYAFSSPSAAAEVVAGRGANGRISWVVEDTGQTYHDWEAAQISEATP